MFTISTFSNSSPGAGHPKFALNFVRSYYPNSRCVEVHEVEPKSVDKGASIVVDGGRENEDKFIRTTISTEHLARNPLGKSRTGRIVEHSEPPPRVEKQLCVVLRTFHEQHHARVFVGLPGVFSREHFLMPLSHYLAVVLSSLVGPPSVKNALRWDLAGRRPPVE